MFSLRFTVFRGYNALHHAVQYNRTLVAHFLLEKGIEIDSVDSQGHTPLMWASYRDHEDTIRHLNIVKFLSERYLASHGAELNAKDNVGFTALHWAATKGNVKALNALVLNLEIDLKYVQS